MLCKQYQLNRKKRIVNPFEFMSHGIPSAEHSAGIELQITLLLILF